jgi:hypothetical protein
LVKVAASPLLSENASGEPEFQGLHGDRRSVPVGLADEQMDMLGHDHKTEHHETIASAGLFKNAKEQVAAARRAQEWLTLITTAGDEM